MSDEVLFMVPPPPPEGLFEATIIEVKPVTVETAEGMKQLVRWTVAIDLGDEDIRQTDALSSLMFTRKSKARRWAIAAGVDASTTELRASDLVGREVMAMVIKKDSGDIGLGDILPVPKKGGKAA